MAPLRLSLVRGLAATVLPLAAALPRPAAADTLELPEVVVGASKIPIPLRSLSSSATVITAEDIERGGYTDTTEILRATVGVEFKQAGGPGQFSYPKLRGMGQGHFLVVVDGVVINEGLSGGVGNVLGQLDPRLIERIEILRGPQATLYGANTSAGVIAITTRRGGSGGRVGVEAGSLGWRKAYASLGGALEDFSYTVGVNATDSDGVHEHESYENLSPSLSFAYRPGARLSVQGSLFYQDTHFEFAELRESYDRDSPETPWWAIQMPDPNQFNENEQWIGSLTVDHMLSEMWSQHIGLGYTRKYNANRDDDDGLLGYAPAPFDGFVLDYGGPSYGRGEPVPVYDRGDGIPYYNRNRNLQFDYWLLNEGTLAGRRNDWLIGYQYLDQKGEKWGKYGEASSATAVHSLYTNDRLELSEQWELTAGLRVDDHEAYGSEVTGKLGLAFNPTETTTLFARVGTSFHAPTFSQLFDPKYGNPDLRPETGETAEIGWRQWWFEDRLSLSVTGWVTRLDDVIAYESGLPPDYIGTYVNRDKGQTRGVEVEGQTWLDDHWSLRGQYAYTEAWNEVDGQRSRTVQIARHKGAVGLDYDADRWSVGVQVFATGPRLRWNGDKEMPGYARVDVSGRWQVHNDIAVYGRIENLFDRTIVEGLGFEQPGRYTVVGLEWTF